MTKQSPQGFNLLKPFNRSLFLKQSVSLISGLGILSTGVVWSQNQAAATSNVVIPETSAPVDSPPETAPANATPSVKTVTPIAPQPKMRLSAPRISLPTSPSVKTPARIFPEVSQSQPPDVQFVPRSEQTGKNSLIDTTNYSLNPPKKYQPPSAVVLQQRAGACQTASQNGRLSSGRCGAIAQQRAPIAQKMAKASEPPSHWVAAANNRSWRGVQPVRLLQAGKILHPPSVPESIPTTNGQPVQSWQPLVTQPGGQVVSLGLEPISQYDRATTMGVQPQPPVYGRTSLMFPLSLPAHITSAFGWRIHPISGTARMHQGTDIGVPVGTPVLAAYPGEVAEADWAGGYGLMVALRHENGTQESRYAHLSQIFVRVGEWVQQGAVIGLVGSTGASTGPHLHFEWRHLTEEGWIAVDAGQHLEYALDNLIQSMGTAQASPNPEANSVNPNPQG